MINRLLHSAVFRVPALALIIVIGADTVFAQESRETSQVALERPRVMVVPFVNATGQGQNDALADTTTDTIRLTINLLGTYDLVNVPDLTPEQEALPLADLAAELSEQLTVEDVVFGRVTRDENGTFVFSLSVWNRREQRVSTTTEKESDSLFGVFDAADELVAEAVSAFSGVRIGFASIRFTAPTGQQYRVYLDNSLVGDNVSMIDRVLIGDRTIRVAQVLGNRERNILTETMTLKEGDSRTIAIVVPEVTPEEIARAEELVGRIEARLDLGVGLGTVSGDLEDLADLLDVAPGAVDESGTLAYLERRWEIVQLIPRAAQTDFAAVAADSTGDSLEVARRFAFPIRGILDEADDERETGRLSPRTQRLEEDALRSAAVFYDLIILRRAAIDRDEIDLLTNLNNMITFMNGQLAQGRSFERPYGDATPTSLRFDRRYDRAMRRRRPFWHYIAGTAGTAGILGGLFLQTVDIPARRDNIALAQEDYNNATSVADATSLRTDLENQNTQLMLVQAAGGAAFATGVLLPIAIISRIRSLSRPGRLWRDYQDTPHRVSVEATALDVRDRTWEEDTPALLVLGEDERISIIGGEESIELPVYIEFGEGQSAIEVRHDSSPLGGRPTYAVPREDGLNVLYLGEPLPER